MSRFLTAVKLKTAGTIIRCAQCGPQQLLKIEALYPSVPWPLVIIKYTVLPKHLTTHSQDKAHQESKGCD